MSDRSPTSTVDPTPRRAVDTGPLSRSVTAWLVVVLIVALVLLTVAVATRWAPLMDLDGTLERAAHRLAVAHRDTVVAVFGVITDLGSPVGMNLVALVGAVALVATARRREAAYLVAARLVELGVATLLKNTVERPRPVWIDPVETATSTSFPSGHSAGTAVVCLCLLVIGLGVVGWPQRTLAQVGAAAGVVVGSVLLVAVPVSRVVLGVHYPSDVVAGVVLGAVVAVALCPVLGPAMWSRSGASAEPTTA